MTEDNIDHIIIEHLRSIRSSLARHDQKFEDVLSRLNHLERNMTRLHGEYADTQEYAYRQQSAIDRLSERVERIEKRLELRD